MGCNCGKPKCDGQCGCKSPAVLQINNPPEYITFHKVSVPAVMGDSKTNPPAVGKYKNVLLYYEADQTSWLYSTDGIPTKLTNGITNYEDAINLPQINGHTLIGDKTGEELGLQDKLTAGENIQISDENVISATDTTYTAGDGIEINSDNEVSAKIRRGLEFNADGEINVSEDYIIGFDTVADMQSSTNLVNGSFARTLGYYSKNDGGGALYKIRNITNDDVIDEASIIEMGDGSDELIAELINKGNVNIKQFGAYGDGTHEDSTAFTKAINYLKAGKTVSDYSSINTLQINGGKYKISNTVNLSVFVRIETIGYATIESYCSGTTFRLSPEEAEKDTGIDRYNYLFGSLIDGSKGLRVINKLDSRGNTIAFALGADNATDSDKSYNLSKTSFRYITINNFDTAIKIYPINFYVNDFHNIYCEQNNKTIVVGDTNGTYFDSGENISFNNSIFAGCGVVCRYNTPQQSIDFNFNECSFDYNQCIFYSPNNNENTSPSRKISIDNSHIETVSYQVASDSTPHGILFGGFRGYQITISNSRILQTNKYHLFYSSSDTSYVLNLISNIINVYGDENATDPVYQYYANDHVKNINLFNNNCVTKTGIATRLPSHNLCVLRPDWRGIETGTTFTLTKNLNAGTEIGDFKNGFFNAVGDPQVVENSFGGKSLKFTVDTSKQWDPYNQASYASIALLSKPFRLNAGEKIGVNFVYKNIYLSLASFRFRYFDYDGNQITSENLTSPITHSENYQVVTLPRYSQAPVGTYTCDVQINCTQKNPCVNGDTFEYGNISIIKM